MANCKTDLNGRSYAKVSDVTVGTTLVADGGFTCLENKAKRTVYYHGGGLCIECSSGNHNLDGQFDIDDQDGITFYTGLYLALPEPPK